MIFLLTCLVVYPRTSAPEPKQYNFSIFSLPLHADTILLTPSWGFSLSFMGRIRWDEDLEGTVSWHIRRLLDALFLTDWNFANFMDCHEHCNGRCPRDVYIHIPLLVWLIASSDKSYICIGKSVSISAWASTLLVQQSRAMRRPQSVERVTGRSHVFRLI